MELSIERVGKINMFREVLKDKLILMDFLRFFMMITKLNLIAKNQMLRMKSLMELI